MKPSIWIPSCDKEVRETITNGTGKREPSNGEKKQENLLRSPSFYLITWRYKIKPLGNIVDVGVDSLNWSMFFFYFYRTNNRWKDFHRRFFFCFSYFRIESEKWKKGISLLNFHRKYCIFALWQKWNFFFASKSLSVIAYVTWVTCNELPWQQNVVNE